MIPFINRTSDAVLSDRLDARQVNVREVIDEFKSQCESFSDLFEAFVLIAPGRIRVTCKSSRKLEIAEHVGFVVRGLPVEFVPVSTFRWVNITRLSYGVPDEDIREALRPYGRIKLIKHEQYQGVYTGVRNCLMEISQEIPARLRISGHWCFVHYRGQKKLCFSCGKEGHMSGQCPDKPRDAGVVHRTGQPELVPAVPVDQVIPPVVDLDPEVVESVNSVLDAITTASSLPVSTPVNVGASTSAAGPEELVISAKEVVPPSQRGDVAKSPLRNSKNSIVGSKRRRSPRSRSVSPVLKDRRRDKSPWGHVISSSEDDTSGRGDDDDFSFDSDVASGWMRDLAKAASLPIPNDDGDELLDRVMDDDFVDTPSTLIAPNLPCITQERQHFSSEPEDTQASEESAFIKKIFSSKSSHHSVKV